MRYALAAALLAFASSSAGALTVPPESAPPPGVVLDADRYYGGKGKTTAPRVPHDPFDCLWRKRDWHFLFPGDGGYVKALDDPEYRAVTWCPPRGGEPRLILGNARSEPARPSAPRPRWFGGGGGNGGGTSSPPPEPPTPDTPAPIPLPAAGWMLLTALGGLGFAAWRRR